MWVKVVEFTLSKDVRTVKYAKLNDLQQKILALFSLNAEDMMVMMNQK